MTQVVFWLRPAGGHRALAGRWIRGGSGGLVALAIAVGVGSGLGAVIFRWLIVRATHVFAGTSDYSGAGRVPNHWVPWLGVFFIVLAPMVGGLVYGPLVDRFAREARGHGVPEVMYAVSQRGGRIPARVAGVKALASAVCIGSGGSVGREGPIVQVGSALGSWVGQLARVPESQLRTLVACGAAGGIAATFNAPLAGVFFALELILGNFAAGAFAAVVLSSVTASVIGRAAFGDHPFLRLPVFSISSPVDYAWYVGLGLLAALVGVFFTRVLYAIEDVCDWVWRGPEWARPAVGGLLLGLLLLAIPQLYGVGYPVLENGVAGRYAIGFLVLLLFGKILATSLTIGIGGSGGVFAPSLFVGAMLGSGYGAVLHELAPGTAGPQGAYALVGMGAVFAGAARAPITAVVIMFELTGEYTIILPLMLAIVVATGVSRLVMADTVYTAKLRRRGVNLDHRTVSRPAAAEPLVTVVSAMVPAPPGIPHDIALSLAAGRILASGGSVLPVQNGGQMVGVVTARAVAEALSDEDSAALTVASVTEQPPVVTPGTSLQDAANILATAEATGTAVIDDSGDLVGWLTYHGLLEALTLAEPRAVLASTP